MFSKQKRKKNDLVKIHNRTETCSIDILCTVNISLYQRINPRGVATQGSTRHVPERKHYLRNLKKYSFISAKLKI